MSRQGPCTHHCLHHRSSLSTYCACRMLPIRTLPPQGRILKARVEEEKKHLPELAESMLAPLMVTFPEVSSAAPTRKGGCPGLLYAYSLPDGRRQRRRGIVSAMGTESYMGLRHICSLTTGRTFEGGLDETVLIFNWQLTSELDTRRARHCVKRATDRTERRARAKRKRGRPLTLLAHRTHIPRSFDSQQ